jgi:hypothetical protein
MFYCQKQTNLELGSDVHIHLTHEKLQEHFTYGLSASWRAGVMPG